MSSDSDSETDSETSPPVALYLGELVFAKPEWEALASFGDLRHLKHGRRDQFLRDCKSGIYDSVVVISRTFDSIEITGPFDQELVDALPESVRFICHNGAGYDQVDVSACTGRGISVSNTPRAVDACTANTTIYLLLGALRRLHIPTQAIRAGQWRGSMSLGHDPDGKTLGILGMGGIGTAVARRALAFDFKLQYHNRHRLPPEQNPCGVPYVDFETLLRTSDAISVHLPLGDGTRGIIGREEFAMMKEGVVIVNTARGPIIDEQALVEALQSGKVFGAGLDVYEKEPEVHEGLIASDHCILLPHIGTATYETQYQMESLVIANIRSALEKGQLLTPVSETRKALKLT